MVGNDNGGSALRMEAENHGDMVIVDVEETPRNEPLKVAALWRVAASEEIFPPMGPSSRQMEGGVKSGADHGNGRGEEEGAAPAPMNAAEWQQQQQQGDVKAASEDTGVKTEDRERGGADKATAARRQFPIWVLKANDDVFVDVPTLLEKLGTPEGDDDHTKVSLSFNFLPTTTPHSNDSLLQPLIPSGTLCATSRRAMTQFPR